MLLDHPTCPSRAKQAPLASVPPLAPTPAEIDAALRRAIRHGRPDTARRLVSRLSVATGGTLRAFESATEVTHG